jgi:hypothetical protein
MTHHQKIAEGLVIVEECDTTGVEKKFNCQLTK